MGRMLEEISHHGSNPLPMESTLVSDPFRRQVLNNTWSNATGYAPSHFHTPKEASQYVMLGVVLNMCGCVANALGMNLIRKAHDLEARRKARQELAPPVPVRTRPRAACPGATGVVCHLICRD